MLTMSVYFYAADRFEKRKLLLIISDERIAKSGGKYIGHIEKNYKYKNYIKNNDRKIAL